MGLPLALTHDTYTSLLDSAKLLGCLFKVGVEDWEGFAEAEELYNDLTQDND